jgi:hypothetical protein
MVWCSIIHSHWQGPVSILRVQTLWDFWWRKWHQRRICSKYFSFGTSITHIYSHSILIYLSPIPLTQVTESSI